MNPLITRAGEPTSLALFLDYVRREGVYNMVTNFRDAVAYAKGLWESQTHAVAPFRLGFTRGPGIVTLADYMGVYMEHEDWAQRCKTLHALHGTLLNIVQQAPAPVW